MDILHGAVFQGLTSQTYTHCWLCFTPPTCRQTTGAKQASSNQVFSQNWTLHMIKMSQQNMRTHFKVPETDMAGGRVHRHRPHLWAPSWMAKAKNPRQFAYPIQLKTHKKQIIRFTDFLKHHVKSSAVNRYKDNMNMAVALY